MNERLRDILIRVKGDARHLVETGTHHGDGIETALAAGFEFATSFEIDAVKVEAARRRFAKWSGVEIVHESSLGDRFAELAKGERKVFWLDAHKMGPQGRVPQDYPLTAELDAILRGGVAHTVVMDDVRLFARYGTSVDAVVSALSVHHGGCVHEFATIRDAYPDDVLVVGMGLPPNAWSVK